MASAKNQGEFFGVHAKKVGPPPSFTPRPLEGEGPGVRGPFRPRKSQAGSSPYDDRHSFGKVLNSAAVCPFVASKILGWKSKAIPGKLNLDTHERNQNQTFPPLAGPARADRPVQTGPVAQSATSAPTSAGQSSAFPDTPRDLTCVTATIRGVRKNFAAKSRSEFRSLAARSTSDGLAVAEAGG